MADWGTNGAGGFIQTTFSDVHPDIDPSNITLPAGFSVCVIGASRGIGAGIATSYAKAGASIIVLAGRRISGLEEVALECKQLAKTKDVKVLVVQCDLSIPTDVEVLASKTKEACAGDGLDVLALNSGVSGNVHLKLHEVPTEEFLNTTAINYTGTFLSAKHFIPLLLSKPDGGKTFAIVSSLASLIVRGPIANAQYCVGKAAQLRLAEHLHEEYHAAEGLRVFCVHPGAVASEQALLTAPPTFRPFLTDGPGLCGGFLVWISGRGGEADWLSGRLVSAKWDVGELEGRREEIVAGDLLKLRFVLE